MEAVLRGESIHASKTRQTIALYCALRERLRLLYQDTGAPPSEIDKVLDQLESTHRDFKRLACALH